MEHEHTPLEKETPKQPNQFGVPSCCFPWELSKCTLWKDPTLRNPILLAIFATFSRFFRLWPELGGLIRDLFKGWKVWKVTSIWVIKKSLAPFVGSLKIPERSFVWFVFLESQDSRLFKSRPGFQQSIWLKNQLHDSDEVGGWAYFMADMSHEKRTPTFHYTRWLIGILIYWSIISPGNWVVESVTYPYKQPCFFWLLAWLGCGPINSDHQDDLTYIVVNSNQPAFICHEPASWKGGLMNPHDWKT